MRQFVIGSPTDKLKSQVQEIITSESIDGLIRVDSNPPDPNHPHYSLVLHGLLVQETYIGMETADRRSYEPIVGIEVVQLSEIDVKLLSALSDDEALPTLLRVMGRNLRRWINEPNPNAGARRLVQHAYELRYIGAIRAASMVAGQALEPLIIQWSGLSATQVKAEKLMLGTLITKAKGTSRFSQDVEKQLRKFSGVRTKCAHAFVDGNDDDAQLQVEVDEFIEWLNENF